ncbi:MAG: phosphoribosylaminoimidazolesuccinocarboxamide synthase [Bacteroidales bacterium]|nr:phosphoribosylaminoimidazolesuccinocarboxamide synthase [Candidatus Cryptobacteroides choladohippi]MCQ2179429.1 phosphoribosylaminoimidazolesuccinocarboxamide synthase [Bacteroidales bacterium]
MSHTELIYDGKEKKVYATENPDIVLIHYNDLVSAFGGIKTAVIKGKGICNNHISAIVFQEMTKADIPNHFISLENDREMLCRRIESIPIQIIVRNRLAGTTARMLGVASGTSIPNTVYELRYNCDALADPMINEHHAVALGLVSYEEIDYMMELARRTNRTLKALYHKAGIELVDFKMECGRTSDGSIIVSDEVSPDNSRLWDEKTGAILDKDRFRHDLSDVTANYKEVQDRLTAATKI